MYDVITLGSATIDCFVFTGNQLFTKAKKSMKKYDIVHVPFGTKIVVDEIDFKTGGGGTNTAVAFAKLNLNTAFLGKLGGSQAGQILEELKREKVDTSLIVPGNSTGYSVVLDASGHDRTILAHKGCNNQLRLSEVKISRMKTSWFYMASMVGESYKTMLALAPKLSKQGVKIAFNPSSYIAKQGHRKLKSILAITDVLVFNREEAGELLGKEYPMPECMKRLRKLVKGIVVVTDGSNGTHCSADKLYYLPISDKRKPVETTGAGDSYAAGFVAGLIMKKDIETCMLMGQANAESVVRQHGAKNGLLKLREMQQRMKKLKGMVKVVG